MEIINVADQIIEVNVTNDIVNIQAQTGAYPLPNNVYSVFGRVGNVVAASGDYNTDLVGEGLINRYYTDARSRAAISENITGMEYSSASGIFSLTSGYVIPTQAMLDAKVPYTGATGNVNLGEHQISAGQVTFDQTPTGAAGVGILRWNDTDGTLDLGLKGGNVTLQVGQEMVARVVNKTGADLLESQYRVVKISSAQGQRLAVQLAQANNDNNSADTLGIVTENIANNQEGFITILGQVKGINTTGSLQGETWVDGDVLYLSPTTAGAITNIKPAAPYHMVVVGYVEYAHQNNGKIYAKVQNGYELEELHDVAPLPYINKGVLYRDTATNLWKSATIDTLLGYTPVTSARTISTTAPLTGGGDLSANRTLAITQATTSTNGYLSSTDWNTFNNKQPLITAGTTAQYYRGDKTFQTLDTSVVPENTNLYYTDTRARAAITGTAPISVASGVVSISQAGASTNGYLSSTDWNTFNNKQAAGNYITALTGEVTASGPGSASATLLNSAVTGKVLTGLNVTGGSVSATDSILAAFGKVQNQINGLIGGSIYQSVWNASTNTPTLASGVGTKGYYYIVNVAGSTNLDGITDWKVGDWAIYDGTAWQKVDNTDAVSSVNGFTGAVSLTTDNISEGSTNLYFTNTRAQNAITLTTTGTSGAATYSGGTLNIPQYQAVLTNPVTGTGTTNTLPKFTGTSAIGNSNITDTGSLITLGSNSYVNGNVGIGSSAALATTNLFISRAITGGVNAWVVYGSGTIQSDVTAHAQIFRSDPLIAASAFTLNQLSHFNTNGTTLGAGSSVTNQYGFFVNANFIQATNNYGFRGLIPSGTNRWNLFMDGTAANYLAGKLLIGSTTDAGAFALQVTGDIIAGRVYSTGITDGVAFALNNNRSIRNIGGTTGTGTTFFDLNYCVFRREDGASTGARIGINMTPTETLDVTGTGRISGTLTASSFIPTSSTIPTNGMYLSGTNTLGFATNGTLDMVLDANGALGIGTTSLTGYTLRTGKNITGATTAYGIASEGTIQSDVTSTALMFTSRPATAAATFNIGTLGHYYVTPGSMGAGSTIGTQIGFWVSSGLTTATTNYAFYSLLAAGTGRWNIYMEGTANNYLAGSLGIGSTSLTEFNLRLQKNIVGSTTSYGISSEGTIQSSVTVGAAYYSTSAATQATTFTLANLYHYVANQGTLGAGSTITNQYGFFANTQTNATNNYGFYGNIASGTNRWNLYMAGTAANYMAGQVGVGATSINASAKVQIDSTTQGFLPPRMTAAQRAAIASPATGLMVYQTDGTVGLYIYDGSTWRSLTMV